MKELEYAYPDYLNDLEAGVWAKLLTVDPQATVKFSSRIEITES